MFINYFIFIVKEIAKYLEKKVEKKVENFDF